MLFLWLEVRRLILEGLVFSLSEILMSLRFYILIPCITFLENLILELVLSLLLVSKPSSPKNRVFGLTYQLPGIIYGLWSLYTIP